MEEVEGLLGAPQKGGSKIERICAHSRSTSRASGFGRAPRLGRSSGFGRAPRLGRGVYERGLCQGGDPRRKAYDHRSGRETARPSARSVTALMADGLPSSTACSTVELFYGQASRDWARTSRPGQLVRTPAMQPGSYQGARTPSGSHLATEPSTEVQLPSAFIASRATRPCRES